jgi:hypothetical protein
MIGPGGPRRVVVRRGPEPFPEDIEDELAMSDEGEDYADGGYPAGPDLRPGPDLPLGYAPGGMIVETITTTTTYPPTTQRRRR